MRHPNLSPVIDEFEAELVSARRSLAFWQAQRSLDIFRPDGSVFRTREMMLADLPRQIKDLEDAIAILRAPNA